MRDLGKPWDSVDPRTAKISRNKKFKEEKEIGAPREMGKNVTKKQPNKKNIKKNEKRHLHDIIIKRRARKSENLFGRKARESRRLGKSELVLDWSYRKVRREYCTGSEKKTPMGLLSVGRLPVERSMKQTTITSRCRYPKYTPQKTKAQSLPVKEILKSWAWVQEKHVSA